VGPSERVKYIKKITTELGPEDWTMLDVILKQFMLPTQESWSGDKQAYIAEMLGKADDAPLLEIAKHYGIASQLENLQESSYWEPKECRIFLSHLTANKVETSELSLELGKYGIRAFVAHEDIMPSKEWQVEIESALATMDGLVALLSPDFVSSNWCDQEVGVAIGRRVPIISVKHGVDPHGFIGKYQAIQGGGKSAAQLAREIYDIFIENPILGPKITSVLVESLVHSESFRQSKWLVGLIGTSKHLTIKHSSLMKKAAESNGQVSKSYGVPQKIKEIAYGLEDSAE